MMFCQVKWLQIFCGSLALQEPIYFGSYIVWIQVNGLLDRPPVLNLVIVDSLGLF
jgi:hypothetical protein